MDIDPRALDKDLIFISRSASILLTLMQIEELELLNIDKIGRKAEKHGLEWLHAPIQDFSVPDDVFMEKWPRYSSHIRDILNTGENIVIHCWGGYGRTGTAAAILLIDMGLSPSDAVKLVRQTRRGTIETDEQEGFCLGYRYADH